MHIKLDLKLETITISALKEFRFKISGIIGIDVSNLHFCCAKQGCIEVTWQIPCFITQLIFPLSSDQEKMLEQLGVIQLSCLNYEYAAPVSRVCMS